MPLLSEEKAGGGQQMQSYLIISYVKTSYYLNDLLTSFPKLEGQEEDLDHSVSVQGKARVALVLRDN